jgi:hypothetical protein
MENNTENNDLEADAYFEKLKGKNLSSGYTTPEGYFDSLKEETFNRISVLKIKERVETDGYEVPEGYFQTLGSRIKDQIASTESEAAAPVKIVKLWQSSLFKYASAACFVIVATFGIYFNQQPNNTKPRVSMIAATDQDLYDIDEEFIIEDLKLKEETIQTPVTAASNAEIEKYILNNYSTTDISSNY